jgi:hypothetical protein
MAKKESRLWIQFRPVADITAYELATIINHVEHAEQGALYVDHKILINRQNWDSMPAEIQRHFALLEYH